MKIIYLDNAASTKIPDKVAKNVYEKMIKFYGNPSSAHSIGEAAKKEFEKAKASLASLINAKPWEIIITSGGTESNNLAIIGAARASGRKKIIISRIPTIIRIMYRKTPLTTPLLFISPCHKAN